MFKIPASTSSEGWHLLYAQKPSDNELHDEPFPARRFFADRMQGRRKGVIVGKYATEDYVKAEFTDDENGNPSGCG